MNIYITVYVHYKRYKIRIKKEHEGQLGIEADLLRTRVTCISLAQSRFTGPLRAAARALDRSFDHLAA